MQELKNFFFGRDEGISLFERILSTPGTSKLIEVLWVKFDLGSREEIFNVVSTLEGLQIYDTCYVIFKYFDSKFIY